MEEKLVEAMRKHLGEVEKEGRSLETMALLLLHGEDAIQRLDAESVQDMIKGIVDRFSFHLRKCYFGLTPPASEDAPG